MKLRTLLFFNLLAVFLIVGLLVVIVLKYQAFHSLRETERQTLHIKNVQITRIIQNEIKQLNQSTRDWAQWDDSYRFMQDRNRQYIESNMGEGVPEVLGTMGLLYLNLEFKEFYSYTSSYRQKNFDKIIDLIEEKKNLFLDSRNSDIPGILLYHPDLDAHFWSVIQPIISSDGQQPPIGYLVLIKAMDRTFYNKISYLLDMTIKPAVALPHQYPTDKGSIFCQNVALLNDAKARLDVSIKDAEGKKPLFLQAETGRLLNMQIQQAFTSTLIVIMASGLIIIVMNLIILQTLVIRPTSYLSKKFKALGRTGTLAHRLKFFGALEIRELTSSANMMLGTIEALNSQLKEQSHTDELTQVFNRRYFQELFARERATGIREQQPLTLLLLDVDFFKQYNDNYGHVAGDKCLILITDILKNTVKRANDVVARFGGEEFIIMLSNTPKEGAEIVCQRIFESLKAVSIPHEYSSVANHVTCSIGGISIVPTIKTDEQALLLVADELLYQAKGNGRNQYVLTDYL